MQAWGAPPQLQLTKSGLLTTPRGGRLSLETGWLYDSENRRKYGESLNGTRWILGDKGRFLEGSCEFLGIGVMVNENQLGKCLHRLPEVEKTCGWKSEWEKENILYRAGTKESGRHTKGTKEVALKGRNRGDC